MSFANLIKLLTNLFKGLIGGGDQPADRQLTAESPSRGDAGISARSGAATQSAATAKTEVLGPVFAFAGEVHPLPSGFDGLSAEDWFFRLETIRDRMMYIDNETLPAMFDEDGDELDPEEILLITEYGFLDGGHYEDFRNYSAAKFAAQTGESPTDCEFRLSGIARERVMAEKAKGMSSAGGALEPVEGVSVEQWAGIQAALAGGQALGTLLGQVGIDQARWERVSAEWMQRMQTDTTCTISVVYSNAFAGGGQFGAQGAHAASQGVGGDLSSEPIAFERYVEIMEAQGAAADRGEDASACLASFGISAMDWSNIGMFWSKKIQQEATKYHVLYSQYSAKYSAQYGT